MGALEDTGVEDGSGWSSCSSMAEIDVLIEAGREEAEGAIPTTTIEAVNMGPSKREHWNSVLGSGAPAYINRTRVKP